jgi:OOP family OmpA-OmpF porin
MRAVLGGLCLLGLIATGWHALAVKAPRIEAEIAERARQAVEPLAIHEVSVRADGRRVVLAGRVHTSRQGDRLARAVGQLPGVAAVRNRLVPLPRVSPYRLNARLDSQRLTLTGHVPTEAARGALLAMAGASGRAVRSDLALAAGVDVEAWTALAADALRALGRLEDGRLDIADSTVSLSGRVASDPALEALGPLLGAGWTTEIAVIDPDPPARLAIRRRDGEPATLEGRLPRGLERAMLRQTFPQADLGQLAGDGRGDPDAWARAVEALAVVLPRFGTLEAVLEGGEIRVTGRLREGFPVKETRAALRAALGEGWRLSFAAEEAPPAARIELAKASDGISVNGILPQGLSPNQVLTALGGEAEDTLTGGGAGDTGAWSRALATLGRLLAAYETAEAALGGGRFAVEGRLAPGHDPAALAEWAAARLAPDWEVTLGGEAAAAAEGATRENPITGMTERLANGYWLPVLDFRPTLESCDRQATLAQAESKIRFVSGSVEIRPEAAPVLDRLAAVVARCFAETGLRLQVGGHTDSVGDPAENLRLSKARAEEVVDALAARGLARGRMLAVGFGQTLPVDTNDTAEGRARNRRITFAWSRRPGPRLPERSQH